MRSQSLSAPPPSVALSTRSQTPTTRAAVRSVPLGAPTDAATSIGQIVGYARLLIDGLQGRVEPHHIQDLRNIEVVARRLLGLTRALEGGDDASGPESIGVPFRFEEPAPAPEAEPSDGGLASILVVDDSRMNRDILCRFLRGQGYRTVAAEDGPRALALAARERFDLVLLDVNMPGISGLGVLGALRGSRTAAELPVIMVTTRGAGEDVVESLKLGANDHVSKPIDFEVLLARLRTQLTLKRSREQLAQLAEEVSAKSEFIRQTFGRYLSHDVVTRLLETPEAQRPGGEEREVTIMMADVRSFTTVTEYMSPELVMGMLNTYLGEMARIITARGGTIVEFIGDAILAIFGAPFAAADDARRAVACALEMEIAMDLVNDRNAQRGLPSLQMGIGLNTGTVVVGNIGSEARTKYGVVGAQVNLTARIESCAVGRQILISESTRAAAGPGLMLADSHTFSLKGFEDGVVAHDLVGLDGPERIVLPDTLIALRPLSRPFPIECRGVVDKRVASEPSAGLVVALSHSGAALRVRPRPAPFTNLHLRFPAPLADHLGGELYAKVIGFDPHAEDTCHVRFTSTPPGLAAIVEEVGRRLQ